jgi:anaerobic magnesium-protoporphyrin IX monomethyl ester cyclase
MEAEVQMKILFVNPIVREDDKPRHIPYGLAQIAGVAEEWCHEDVAFFDANAARDLKPQEHVYKDLDTALATEQFDIIGVGGITTTYASIKRIVKMARQRQKDALIVAGGGFMTSMPNDIMRFLPEVDIGVIGEGELTFHEILKRQGGWNEIKGIIHRVKGEPQLTPMRELIDELDDLPYPTFHLLPMEIYFKNSELLASEEAMSAKRRTDINGSRGCGLVCRFCFHLGLTGDLAYVGDPKKPTGVIFTNHRNVRWNSPSYIVRMVKFLRRKYGVDFISFLDENMLTMNAATQGTWLREICSLWVKEGLQPLCVQRGVPHDPDECVGVHWGGTMHASLVTAQILTYCRESGCSFGIYGLESFNDRILSKLGKGTTSALNERCVKMTLAHGIRPVPFQMIGFPEEGFDSIYDSLDAWERLGIVVGPFYCNPYPGCEWYTTHHDKILKQYKNDLETFIIDLGDATKLTANLSEHFSDVELTGLRELMIQRRRDRIELFQREWLRDKELRGEPIPDYMRLDYKKPRLPEGQKRILEDAEMYSKLLSPKNVAM